MLILTKYVYDAVFRNNVRPTHWAGVCLHKAACKGGAVCWIWVVFQSVVLFLFCWFVFVIDFRRGRQLAEGKWRKLVVWLVNRGERFVQLSVGQKCLEFGPFLAPPSRPKEAL